MTDSEMGTMQNFRERWGPPSHQRPLDDQAIDRLRGRVPDDLLEVLRVDGFASYQQGRLWFVDPDEYVEVAKVWAPDDPKAAVIARNAFGELFLHRFGGIALALIHHGKVDLLSPFSDWFVEEDLVDEEWIDVSMRLDWHPRALNEAGPLEAGEAYVWVPALAMGGSVCSSKIERVWAIEAALLGAQVAGVRFVH